MATEWADTCEWKRGQPTRNESELPYDPIGQNLYVTSDTIDLVSAVQSWYNETENYDYDNNSCSGECGDYIQVGVFSVRVCVHACVRACVRVFMFVRVRVRVRVHVFEW